MINVLSSKDVDLVEGKRTLVRTVVFYNNNGTNNITRTATSRVYLNGTFQNNETINLTYGINNIDVFFVPQIKGQNIPIVSEVSSNIPDFNATNITKSVNVTRTREMNYEINN